MTLRDTGRAQDAVRVETAGRLSGALFDTLTLAFSADPFVRWMFPDTQQYLRAFPSFAKAIGGDAIAAGTAFKAGGRGGTGLWLSPGSDPDEEPIMQILSENVPAARLGQIETVFKALEPYFPGEPFWYLALLGVDPSRQGEGLGSAILGQGLRLCDAESRPAYLEATCEQNAALYRRHGFEQVGIAHCPGGASLIPMVRPAR